MKLAIVPVTPFAQNCSLLVCEETNRAAVFDPGGDLDRIDQVLAETGAALEKVFLTHGHIDHCGQAGEYARRHRVPLEGPQVEDRFWIQQLPEQGKRFGFARLEAFEPDRWLEDGDTVTVARHTFEVLHCPGHSPGSVVLVNRAHRLILMGDVLFRGSIGRTDFPYGDHEALINAITTKLLPLGDDFTFICGHGPVSTIGAERQTNPFLPR